MCYYDRQIDQERLEASDAALCDWASMGVDEALARFPQLASVSSVGGYVAKPLALPTDEKRYLDGSTVVFRDEF